jgi:hypothetical protein
VCVCVRMCVSGCGCVRVYVCTCAYVHMYMLFLCLRSLRVSNSAPRS